MIEEKEVPEWEREFEIYKCCTENIIYNNEWDNLKQFISEQIEKEKKKAEKEAYKKGLIDGLTKYAWWKDGVQYVGTCGTTLKKALEKYAGEKKK